MSAWDVEISKAQRKRRKGELNAGQAAGLGTGVLGSSVAGTLAAEPQAWREAGGLGSAAAKAGRGLKRDVRPHDFNPVGKKPHVITTAHPSTHLRALGSAVGRRPLGAAMVGGAALAAGGVGLYHHSTPKKKVRKSLAVPWEITEVAKGTLGQTARMASIGAKKGKHVAAVAEGIKATAGGKHGKSGLGQANRMAAVNIRSPKRKGVPSWANKAPGDTGPLLSLKSNGFDTLSKPGKRDLVPRSPAGALTSLAGGAAAGKPKKPLKVPGSVAVGAGLAAGSAVGGTIGVEHAKNKKKVSKSLTSTLGGAKKAGNMTGKLKPVQPPKPTSGPTMAKPPTAPKPNQPMTGAKPAAGAAAPRPAATAGPPATLRPPSMMPPKPGVKPKQVR